MGSGRTLVGNMNSKDPKRCGQLVNDVMALKNPKKIIPENAKKYIKSCENVNCEFVTENNRLFVQAIKDIKRRRTLCTLWI